MREMWRQRCLTRLSQVMIMSPVLDVSTLCIHQVGAEMMKNFAMNAVQTFNSIFSTSVPPRCLWQGSSERGWGCSLVTVWWPWWCVTDHGYPGVRTCCSLSYHQIWPEPLAWRAGHWPGRVKVLSDASLVKTHLSFALDATDCVHLRNSMAFALINS